MWCAISLHEFEYQFWNLKIYFKNVEPILWLSVSGFQHQPTGQPMAEMLKSIKEPGATVYEFWIEANFQALNLNAYSHHTSYQIIASKTQCE